MSRDEQAARWFARMRGPVTERDHAKFSAWLRERANAEAYARVCDDWNLAGVASPRRIAEAAAANHRPAPGADRPRWALAGLAAGLALALGLIWHLTVPHAADRPGAFTGAGAVRLADGTRVELMAGARIEARFSGNERRVTMTGGRARFEVAHDAARPFRVFAGGTETTALGTRFEIDLTRPRPRVRLFAGSVEVRPARGGQALRLQPGESAEFDGRRTHRLAATSSSAATLAPPPAGMLAALDLPLGEVVARANRVNPVPIRLDDPALAARRLSGRFELAGSAVLARKLGAALGLEVIETPEAVILRTPAKNPGG